MKSNFNVLLYNYNKESNYKFELSKNLQTNI